VTIFVSFIALEIPALLAQFEHQLRNATRFWAQDRGSSQR